MATLSFEQDPYRLVPLTEEYATAYIDLINADREHFLAFGAETLEAYQDVEDVLESIRHPRIPSRERYIIGYNHTPVGSINATPDRFGEGIAYTVGYWIGGEHVKQGHASQAMIRMRDMLLSRDNTTVIRANLDERNIPSRKVLEQAGLSIESRSGGWLQMVLRVS